MYKSIHTAEYRHQGAGEMPLAPNAKTTPFNHMTAVPPVQGDLAMRILAEDYQDVYLELARSSGDSLWRQSPGSADSAPQDSADEKPPAPPQERAPRRTRAPSSLREEIPLAARAYDEAVDCVRKLMAYASISRLYTGSVDLAVTGIVDSLERNPDAFLCLPRLRQREHYAYTHSVNVAALLAAYALHTGEPREKVLVYALAGLFHDLGKALLPVSLLCARRRLSETERALVKRHPALGCELLAALPDVRSEVLLAVLEHHERYDGSGYPKGISGDSISEIGHLCAIADSYDAISSRRPYKGALFPHRTLGVMYQMRQKQFHPLLMEKFVRMVGVYPVGSIVELEDGYRGVVTASNPENPTQPVVTLAMDADRRSMPLHECDLARDSVAGISRCLSPETAGLNPAEALGLSI